MNRLAWALAITFAALGLGCGGAEVRPPRDPQVVTLEAMLANRFVKAAEPTTVVARVRIGTAPLRGAQRPKINLGLVVDTSGSMEGRMISDARDASLALLEMLRPGDRLAIVVFHSRTEVIFPSTVLDDESMAIARERIQAMQARGTTDLAGGLQAGLEQVAGNMQSDGINRVVLLGDGVPNDPAPVRPLAQAAGERGIAITSLGLGLDYDESIMGDIATLSGGRFHYIERSEAVARVFEREVLRIQRTLARNAVVTLTPGPGVRIDSVVGQQVTSGEDGVNVVIGDLAEGDVRDLIVRLTADGRRAGANVELIDARLTFDDAVNAAGRLERDAYLGARASADDAEIATGRNQEVERAAARMTAAAVTVEAIRLARGGELDRARQILDQAAYEAQLRAQALAAAENEDAEERDRYSRQADSMRVLAGALPSINAPPPSVDAAGSGGVAPTAQPPAAVIREAHDEAMETLQGAAE